MKDLKTRIEFPNAVEALQYAEGKGGWFFVRELDGKCFWYSHHHIPTEICLEGKGPGTLGTYSRFSHLLP